LAISSLKPHLPDDPDKQCTVDEDASSEESSNVALIGLFVLLCLMPPLAVFQLYHGDQF
jgi:hypothetical protein